MQQWLSQLKWVAQTHGNAWVPAQTQPLFHVNLTSIWCPPDNLSTIQVARRCGSGSISKPSSSCAARLPCFPGPEY
jgi:hypothetical protein